MTPKKIEAWSGIFMIIALVLALVLANNGAWYFDFLNAPLLSDALSVKECLKEVLMAMFFFAIGLELRHEFHDGFFADKKLVILPALAALGGMFFPALIYFLVNITHPENYSGFSIPSETDIAFSVCLFNLIGRRLPPSLRIFLLSIAIFDDLGAIIIIAFCYTQTLNASWLLISLPICYFLWKLSRKKISLTWLYCLICFFLCLSLHKAGISTTLGGFLVGMSIPLTNKNGKPYLMPLLRRLTPFVQLAILPLFAFIASGLIFSPHLMSQFLSPIPLGIALGLFFGKQIGVTLFSYGTVKLGLTKLPDDLNFKHIYLMSVFAGIGFTMSLFLGLLSLPSHLQDLVTLGVLIGSFGSALFACLLTPLFRS